MLGRNERRLRMTEFPALRASLVRAAARRRRRRRRLTIRAAVPSFALAAAAVALFALPGGQRDREREVATPVPKNALEESFGVFRPPATPRTNSRPPCRCQAAPNAQTRGCSAATARTASTPCAA